MATESDAFDFTIRIKDPEALRAWCKENLPEDSVAAMSCWEIYDEKDVVSWQANIVMYDVNSATLLKTFWAIGD
jgi:hypothetical protein